MKVFFRDLKWDFNRAAIHSDFTWDFDREATYSDLTSDFDREATYSDLTSDFDREATYRIIIELLWCARNFVIKTELFYSKVMR